MAGIALPSRNLVSQQDAAVIQRPDVPRSRFMGSWSHKKTFDAGFLYPFLIDEVLPGDHLKYEVSAMVRMATPLFPMMDSQRVDTFFFFVPNRLLQTNFIKLMGEQTNPGDSVAFPVPFVTSTGFGFAVGSLGDHFGLPTIGQPSGAITVNVLPFRAYNQIWNQWFRDENLINSALDDRSDTNNVEADFPLRRRAKAHDYFTSCLPWPQKFTAPNISVGGLAPIIGLGLTTTATGGASGDVKETGNPATVNYPIGRNTSSAALVLVNATSTLANAQPLVYANLAAATGVSVNVFREAMMVQTMLERDARGGTRYIEVLKSHFGVTSPDARLDRPEYIGGGSSPLHITPIANTNPTGLGNIGGAGTAAGSHTASYASTEHGFIIGLVNVRSELSYSQGIHKMWKRRVRTDYYWPSLAGLGEQAVLTGEIYALGTAADSVVFGYNERWQEYRTRTSEVTGLFRPTAAGNIDEWHLSQLFSPSPLLNQTFIEDTPPMSRVLAAGASTNQQFLGDFLIRREAVRPLPMYGTPATLGRF